MSVCVIFLKINCSLPYKRRFSKTLKLAKTAFIPSTGQSEKTTQTQLFMKYVYFNSFLVHFNRFIDLTIYSDTNPYNLAKQVFRKVHEKPIMELNNLTATETRSSKKQHRRTGRGGEGGCSPPNV